jgi:UDP-N-acetylmuramate: L-alanyl-gamma-D-glutamyl-meso-diaminopimelate ligase
MRIHFIAIGGSAMHNLALALHDADHHVTGSDDQILEPSRGRLKKAGILPTKEGWFPECISLTLDVVILGMHARPDNPELLRAQKLGVSVQSYPEFLFNATSEQERIVIGGSHGKTTITSMVLHVLRKLNQPVNYMVGAQLEGFDRMVSLNPRLKRAIFEGDEYLSSPIDRRPKFFWYRPHLAILTGISWDHINVFPSEEIYFDQFRQFIQTLAPNATLVWCQDDPTLSSLMKEKHRPDLKLIAYQTPTHIPRDSGTMEVSWPDGTTMTTELVGSHNIQNVAGARTLAREMGIPVRDFDLSIADFRGASRRLESLHSTSTFHAFRDFAHAPSKVKATVSGVKASYPNRPLTAFFELHTFSSLNREFLPTYISTLDSADFAVIYFDPNVLQHKQMPSLDPEFVLTCFGEHPAIEVVISKEALQNRWNQVPQLNHTVLMMSSGWFAGLDMSFD